MLKTYCFFADSEDLTNLCYALELEVEETSRFLEKKFPFVSKLTIRKLRKRIDFLSALIRDLREQEKSSIFS